MSVTDPQALARQLDAEHPAIGQAVKWAAQGGRVLVLYGIRADHGTGAGCAAGWSCSCGNLDCGRPGKHPPTAWPESTYSDPLAVAQAMRRAAYDTGAVNWGRRLDPDWEGRIPVGAGEVPNVDDLRAGALLCVDVDDTDSDGRLVIPAEVRAAMTPEDASYWETSGRGAHIIGRLPDTVTVAQWRRVFGTDYYPDGTLDSRREDGPEKKGGPHAGTGEARMRMVVGAGSRHKSGRFYELMTPDADVPVFSEGLVRVLCGPPDAALPRSSRPLTEQDMPNPGTDTEAERLITERATRVRRITQPSKRNAGHNAQAFALGLQLRRHPHLVEYAREKLEKAAFEARRVNTERVDHRTGELRAETEAESKAEAQRAILDGLYDGYDVPLSETDAAPAPEPASQDDPQGTPNGASANGSAPSDTTPTPAPRGTPNTAEQGSPEVPHEPASQGTPQGSVSTGPHIVTRALDTIGKPRRVRWLDCSIGEGRIPLGMATVIAGDPGVGKGTLGALIAAEVTRQGGTVLISSPEDNAHSVILPRMIAAGADLTRVILTGLAHEADDPLAPFSIELYASQLAEKLETHAADMFLIDPLAEHIGSDVKDNKGTRDAIRPLLSAAEAHETAILLNAHVNRAESASWVKRITGSAAIGQIVRSVMLAGQLPKIAPTQDDMTVPQPVGLIHVKANNGPQQPGLRFQIEQAEVEAEDGPMTTSRMRLCGTWNGREDDLLDERKRPTYEAIGAAAYWLRTELTRGGVLSAKPVAELHEAAKAQDSAWDEKIMRRAAKLIGARNAPISAGGARYYTLEQGIAGE